MMSDGGMAGNTRKRASVAKDNGDGIPPRMMMIGRVVCPKAELLVFTGLWCVAAVNGTLK
jgi:hypothetical protein